MRSAVNGYKYRSKNLEPYVGQEVTVRIKRLHHSKLWKGILEHNAFILNYPERPAYILVENGKPTVVFSKQHVKQLWSQDGTKVDIHRKEKG